MTISTALNIGHELCRPRYQPWHSTQKLHDSIKTLVRVRKLLIGSEYERELSDAIDAILGELGRRRMSNLLPVRM